MATPIMDDLNVDLVTVSGGSFLLPSMPPKYQRKRKMALKQLVEEFISKLETTMKTDLAETLMTTLGINGTHGKPIGLAKVGKVKTGTKAQQLQGKYLGSLNGLSQKDAAKIKKIRAKDGVEQAIQAAQKLKPKSIKK